MNANNLDLSRLLSSGSSKDVSELLRLCTHMQICLELKSHHLKACMDTELVLLSFLVTYRCDGRRRREEFEMDCGRLCSWMQSNPSGSDKKVALSILSLSRDSAVLVPWLKLEPEVQSPVDVLLNFVLLVPFLTNNQLVGSILRVSRASTEGHHNLLRALACTLSRTRREVFQGVTTLNLRNTTDLVDIWAGSQLASYAVIASTLDNVIVSVLENGDDLSKACLLSSLCSMPPMDIMFRALDAAIKDTAATSSGGLLHCLLQADPSRYGHAFLHILDNDKRIQTAWSDGTFDHVLLSMPREIACDDSFVRYVTFRLVSSFIIICSCVDDDWHYVAHEITHIRIFVPFHVGAGGF